MKVGSECFPDLPKLSVVVFIHGDSFVRGSGNLYSDAAAFAAEADVVVVTINYRMGVLGKRNMFISRPWLRLIF